MRSRYTAAMTALLLTCSIPAWAAGDTPTNPEHDAVFRAGMEQYEKGNRTAAISTWENLLATLGEERGYKILYNLGIAYQASGDVTRAIERYHAFVDQVRKRDNASKDLQARANDAASRLDQLESAHGAVNVRAPSRGGLVLTRVGTGEPRAAGYTVWLAPGPHTIELFIGTQNVERRSITVEKGKAIVIETSPAEPPAAPPVVNPTPPPATTPPPASSAKPTPPAETGTSSWVWIGAGATLATIALPVVSYLVASGKHDDAVAAGRGSSQYPDAVSSYDTWRTMHYVSYAVPAILGGLTVVYALWWQPSKRTSVGFNGSQITFGARF